MTADNVAPPRRFADLTPENLRAVIEELGGPGIYPSADLYTWYIGMVEEAGLIPVTKKMFGLTLRKLGYKDVVRRINGKNARCWFITKRAVREHIVTDGTVC